ncbi:APC family permease [Pseudonocardia acaciae]|uniref:APC family permease n=1 Tax=Pseudonocardia acaciae TaxID=551276 RepID=UPI000492098C|nr:APC family permease [Pseudonocardia acaciae]
MIRNISALDSLVGNILIVNFVASVATLVVVPYTFPGANVTLAVVLSMVPSMALATVYVLFTLVMPRSGGEYVFVSRVFHPVVGFAANFSFICWNILFGGLLANQFSTVYLGSFFSAVGWRPALAVTSEKWFVLLVGVLLIALTTIPAIAGTKLAMRLTKWSFFIGVTLLFGVLAVLAFAGRRAFVAAVDEKASFTGILDSARAAGFVPAQSGLAPTLQAVALISLATLFVSCATYATDEVEDVKRSMPRAVYGAALIGGAVMAVMAFIAERAWGSEFLAASNYLAEVAPDRYPLDSPPSFAYLAILTEHNWLFAVAINVSFLSLIVGNMVFATLTMSRCFVVWSFDRITPRQLARVDARRRTPVNALVAFGVLSLLSLFYYTFGGSVTFLAGTTLGFIATFLTVAAAGIVLPFWKKDLYRGSAGDIRFLGIPVIVIAGAASLVMLGAMVYAFLTNDALGANGLSGLLFLGGLWVLGALIFLVARAVQRRRGVPFDATFRELPTR